MTENERFRCLVDYLKENRYIRNQQQFVEDVKSDKTTISQLLNGRISAPKILFGNVCAAYPFISMEWLRDGKGEMLMFLLCGISPVDLFKLERMSHGRVVFRRSKTAQPVDIRVEPEALDIITRYRGENQLINILDNYQDYDDFLKKMNRALKTLGGVSHEERVAKDKKVRVVAVRRKTWPDLSAYWARHTWASIARSLGVPVDVIAQAMGHSLHSVTEIYIARDSSLVDEANRRVIDWVLYGRR